MELTLTSPIKVATSAAAVTADKLQEGQMAICDDGGALGIAGKAGGKLLWGRNAAVPLVLVGGPGYFAAPTDTVVPETDSLAFYTMGCNSGHGVVAEGKRKHLRKKRFTRMGLTSGGIVSRSQTTEAVSAAISLAATANGWDYFTADLSALEGELRRKMHVDIDTSRINTLRYRIGLSRWEVARSDGGAIAVGALIARFFIGVAVERAGMRTSGIVPVRVTLSTDTAWTYPTGNPDASQAQLGRSFLSYWNAVVPVCRYTPRRTAATAWQKPNEPAGG